MVVANEQKKSGGAMYDTLSITEPFRSQIVKCSRTAEKKRTATTVRSG